MPSSNKTAHLQLNKWSGSDKPKKDDFNSDNQKIDEACRLLEQSISLLESAVNASGQASEHALDTLSAAVTSHAQNSAMHVSQSEKDAWSIHSGAILGSYTGDGATTRKITLGYAPLFVFIFPVDDGLGRVSWTNQMYAGNAGCVSSLGSTYGLTLNADGFTVEYRSPGGIDGYQIKHNAPSVKYIYLVFKA